MKWLPLLLIKQTKFRAAWSWTISSKIDTILSWCFFFCDKKGLFLLTFYICLCYNVSVFHEFYINKFYSKLTLLWAHLWMHVFYWNLSGTHCICMSFYITFLWHRSYCSAFKVINKFHVCICFCWEVINDILDNYSVLLVYWHYYVSIFFSYKIIGPGRQLLPASVNAVRIYDILLTNLSYFSFSIRFIKIQIVWIQAKENKFL